MSEQASWRRLGSVAPEVLAGARITLHWAVRVLASAEVLSPAAEAGPGLQWIESLGALVGPPLGGAEGRSVGLRVDDLCLIVVGRDGKEEGQLPLDNLSAENALLWLKFTLGADDVLALDTTGLPAHALEKGAVFDVLDNSAFGELARWYGNAAALLEELRAESDASTEVRCSTASLEMFTSIELDEDGDGKRVEVGLLPGGLRFDAPHWFVRPVPQPGSAPAGELPGGGSWHTDEWIGAVLPGPAVVGSGDAGAQRALVEEFVRAALEQCRALLG